LSGFTATAFKREKQQNGITYPADLERVMVDRLEKWFVGRAL